MTQSVPKFNLIVRQQPLKARLCSFKEKVDRRPIDPPPIIQLTIGNHNNNSKYYNNYDQQQMPITKSKQQEEEEYDAYLQNPYFFLYVTLLDATSDTDLHFVNGSRTTAGTVVQSLHKLKDFDNTEGGFFVFSDVSVRLEGVFRLKFTLFEITGLCSLNHSLQSYSTCISRICHVNSETFQVYSPKSFPGMSESTFLTRSFSDQGVRIRIRKEPRASSSCTKRRRSTMESDESITNQITTTTTTTSPYLEDSPVSQHQVDTVPMTSSIPQQQQLPSLTNSIVLPSPREILRSSSSTSAMSMQNLLLASSSSAASPSEMDHDTNEFYKRKLPFPNTILPSISTPTNSVTNTTSFHWLNPSYYRDPPPP